ncbi:tryptophan--tRNA ligase [Neorickettsia helminthoeca str. Oregon]|uniref:Tryptophan--tRNA ligase n=1 Tax=Neorickettsia helminthoeca str. Oregon TaxID=1286528 RepID=X5H3M5_9RICK|nr:tryptophan--tRNA ligase [Neorickettsia helminthoeca]AHX11161.1 tryptophan--tRNA ligase [Neorickettsia helminthoeca str. Oregon]
MVNQVDKIDKIVLSAVQPTGSVHLGNLFGAIDLWVDLQSKYKTKFYCIADLHSLDGGGAADTARLSVEVACIYIACGIDPTDSHIFVQSHIPQHAELCWLLSCITPTGWLNRMTQYKEKSAARESTMLSLYSYPVLMAADILLYNAELIPVGDDQSQHVELVRDIAARFNQLYGVDHLTLPATLKCELVTRVMGLRDPTKKMSKSDPADFSRINLSDSKDLIAEKINAAKTDSIMGFSVENIEDRPEASNLLRMASYLSGIPIEKLCSDLKTFAELKSLLIDLLVARLSPIQERMQNLERETVSKILRDSADVVREIAAANLDEIKRIMQVS